MRPLLVPELQAEFTNAELDEIWNEVIHEVADITYLTRTHGNRRTYDAGCKGPLCLKATREHGRRRSTSNASEYYVNLDKVLDVFKPAAVQQIEEAVADLLLSLRQA